MSYSTEYGGAPYMVFVFSHCHYTPVFMPLNNIAFHMVSETDQTSDPSVLALSLNFCSNAVGEALVITVTVIRLVLYCGREMTLGSSQILKVPLGLSTSFHPSLSEVAQTSLYSVTSSSFSWRNRKRISKLLSFYPKVFY